MSSTHYTEGRYLCEVVDQGLTKASTGTIQIVLKIRVIEGTRPAKQVDQNYERTVFLAVTERTMEYLVPKLQALGYTRDSLRFIDLNAPQCHDMRGLKVEFFCKYENAQDGSGLREKWDVASNQSKPLDLKPPDSKEMRNLDMLFGRALKQSPSAAKPATRSAGPQPVEMITNDDVPF